MSEPTGAVSSRADLISGSVVIVLGASVLWLALNFPQLPDDHPGPGLFPSLIAAGLLLAGIVLVARAVPRGFRAAESVEGASTRLPQVFRLVVTLALVALYPLLSDFLGFIAAVGLIAFAVAILLGVRIVRGAITAAVAATVIYWLFTALLGVPL